MKLGKESLAKDAESAKATEGEVEEAGEEENANLSTGEYGAWREDFIGLCQNYYRNSPVNG